MNKEITKAINQKKKKHFIQNWWSKNEKNILKVVFFPIWFIEVGNEKVNQKLNNRETWSNKKAKEIFDYYIPHFCDWNEKEKTFYFFDNGYGWNMCFAKKYLKRKDRRFWNKYKGFAGGKLKNYLINNYNLEGFSKYIKDCTEGRLEIIFKMK